MLGASNIYDNFDIAGGKPLPSSKVSICMVTLFNVYFEHDRRLFLDDDSYSEWLSYRANLFRVFSHRLSCINEIDAWYVLVDDSSLPQDARAYALLEALDKIKLVKIARFSEVNDTERLSNASKALSQAIYNDQKYKKEISFQCQIRVDSDDVIVDEYPRSLRHLLAMKSFQSMLAKERVVFVDPIVGSQYVIEPGLQPRLTPYIWTQNAFQCLVSRVEKEIEPTTSVFADAHDRVHITYRQHQLVTSGPCWIQLIHSRNQLNGPVTSSWDCLSDKLFKSKNGKA